MFSESIAGICLAYDYLVRWLREEARWPGCWQSRQNSWLGAPLRCDFRRLSQPNTRRHLLSLRTVLQAGRVALY